ncbi:Sel1 repeat [Plasmodiophora brassicae]|uniref:Uncharacterized protein n=1 Tax=Plasmodiophora brassicae TaxID=37360 RepID=A0A0G4J4L8_PLABS|nr:hypothetical protein PBRA_009104 [Plasmodiophora brassicae]
MAMTRCYTRDTVNAPRPGVALPCNKSLPCDDDDAAVADGSSSNRQFESVVEFDLCQQLPTLPAGIATLYEAVRARRDRQDEFMLGYHFDVGAIDGQTMPASTAQALYWYKRAADNGHTIAQLNLGVLYETGHQNAQARDYPRAVRWYYQAALSGHQGAQFNLGRLFWSGKGVPQDLKTAFGFFKKAAKKGNHMAMTNVGAMYMSGNGVRANANEARRWSQLAAMKSNAVAHHNLGVMYENGLGGRRDLELAASHFRQALDPAMDHPVSEALSRELRRSRDPLIFT